jgi:hypothetical protein
VYEAKKKGAEYFAYLVGSSVEGVAGDGRDLGGDLDVETFLGVESLHTPSQMGNGTALSFGLSPSIEGIRVGRKKGKNEAGRVRTNSSDSSSTLSQQTQPGDDILDPRDGVSELLDVARELLTEGERSGVLKMGSADLDDGLKLGSLDLHSISELVKGREESGVELGNGGDVHGGGEAIRERSKGSVEEGEEERKRCQT